MIQIVKKPIARPKLRHGSGRWQLQEAKAKFSQLFELALNSGPQIVTRRNRDSVVVLSEAEYNRLTGKSKRPSLIEALLACPKVPGFKIPPRDRNDRVPPSGKPLFD